MDKTIIQTITKRFNDLNGLVSLLEKKVLMLPDGRVKINKRNGIPRYYLFDNDNMINGRFLNVSDYDLICRLVQKGYYQKVIKVANEEMICIKKAIDNYPKIIAEDIYTTLTEERRALVNPIFRPDDEFVRNWLSEEYVHKGFKEGTPYYETMNGERVCSKAEQIIADHLKQAGVPYKYEYLTMINGELIHPDFKILRLSDRKEIYLEHCGRVADPEYYDDMVRRINNYAMNGIIIGDNLYLLFETINAPLDVRVLDKLIEEQFR